MRKTDKLVLPLFDPDDRILREDFNQAAQTLDEKIGLTEEVCAILDLPEGATPADALLKLALGPGRYAYILAVVYPDGTPVVNRTVSGVKDVYGNTPVTNENGRVVVIAEEETVTVSVKSEYLDLKSIENQKIEAAGFVTHKTLCLEKNTGDYLLVTASKTYELSPYVRSMDVTAVGGGGGAAGVRSAGSGSNCGESGGGGGYAVHTLDYDVSAHKHIKIVIGSGGSGGQSGASSAGLPYSGTAGETTFVYYTEQGTDHQILTAAGGNPGQASGYGGSGNGKGGNRIPNPVKGEDSTIHIFGDPDLPLAGGGGGSATYAGPGGAPMGGASNEGSSSSNGGVPGGGGAANGDYRASFGGNGGAGGVYFRFHFE